MNNDFLMNVQAAQVELFRIDIGDLRLDSIVDVIEDRANQDDSIAINVVVFVRKNVNVVSIKVLVNIVAENLI